ncbi:MAG: hypothetical protein WDM85_05985 [Caulobacteraceae bacterium]
MCACLAADTAPAAGLDTYPVVTPAAADKLCGYANAAGHVTQCSTVSGLEANATPGGSSGQLQYNASGILGAVPQTIYCATCNGGGPLLALTTPISITNQSFTLINGSAVSYLIASATSGGGSLFMSSGSQFGYSDTALSRDSAGQMDLGSGAVGDKTGQLNLGAVVVGTQLTKPPSTNCTGTISTTFDTTCTPMIIRGGPNGKTLVGNEGLISWGADPGQGLAITSNSNPGGGGFFCGDPWSPYCMGRNIDFYNEEGVQVFGVETGQSDHHSLELGMSRYVDTMQHVSQELILDLLLAPGSIEHFNITNGGSGYTGTSTVALTGTGCAVNPSSPARAVLAGGVITGISEDGDPGRGCSSVAVAISGTGTGATATATLTAGDTNDSTGPTLMWHQIPRSGVAAFPGFGQADLGFNRIRFGEAPDSGNPWNKDPTLQQTLVLSGPLEFDTATGSTFTDDFRVADCSAVLCVQNAAGTAAAPIKVSYERVVPTTVAGLSTIDASPADGDAAFVSDATACTFMSAVAGGGSMHCPVHYDGSSSSWKAG